MIANATLRDVPTVAEEIVPEHVLIHVDLEGNIHHLLHFYERYEPSDILTAFFADRVSMDNLDNQMPHNQTNATASINQDTMPTIEDIDNLPAPLPII